MGMKIHQRTIGSKIVIGGVNTKVRVGDGGARHVDTIDNLLKERRRVVVGLNVVNGERLDEGRKAKRTAYLTKEDNRSPDKRLNHMTTNQQLETNQIMIIERTIGNRLNLERPIRNQPKNDHRKIDWKPIK